MFKGFELALMVFAIGNFSFQVEAEILSPAISISYFVPGASCTRLPRHSLLRASYQSGNPSRHVGSPLLRYFSAQPAEPGSAPGDQYRPIDSNVATAFGAASAPAATAAHATMNAGRI